MMNSLKYEIRQMFDNERSINLFDNTEHLEEGLLERIVNLSVLNTSVFPVQPWTIIAVKSSMTKQKLSIMCNGNAAALNCPVCLIVLSDREIIYENSIKSTEENKLLKTAIMYASKFYAIETNTIIDFDKDAIKKYFKIEDKFDIEMLMCLGYYNKTSNYDHNAHINYSQIVHEV